MHAQEKPDWFDTLMAMAIALVTVTGAILATRAALLGDAASGEDHAGLASAMDRALARSSTQAALYQNLTTFLDFAQHHEWARLLERALDEAPSGAAAGPLEAELLIERNRASTSRSFFTNDYYDKAHQSFDRQAFVEGSLAEAASRQDLAPEPHLAAGEESRARAQKLVGVIAVLSLALLSYTLAKAWRGWPGYVLALGGTAIFLAGVAAAGLVELGVL